MDRKLNGLNPLSYRGVNAYQPPELVMHPRAPTTKDFQNFMLGTIWVDTTNHPPMTKDIYMLVSVARNIATWVDFGGGKLQYLTGNSGGPIGPDALANINIKSGITGMSVVGNPATNTLTITNTGGGALFQTLSDDIGTKVSPDATGDIKILGTAGHIISIGTAITNQIEIDVDGDIADEYVTNAGTAVPLLNSINILGGTNCNTAGAGNTITINAVNSHELEFTVTTNNATPTTLGAKTLTASSAININCLVVGTLTDYSAIITGYTNGGARRAAAGAAILIGSPVSSFSQDTAGTPSFTVNTSGNDVIIEVTGIAATTINWKGYATFVTI